jgi:hypothetical protein
MTRIYCSTHKKNEFDRWRQTDSIGANLQKAEHMNIRTKTVIVHGQEMVMSSVDGRTWFLRMESLYEFEARQHQDQDIFGEEPQELIPS